MAILVEPRVNLEKLRELLDEGTEHSNLDYKRDCDLQNNRDRVELAKDVGAMLAEGGYIVVGADDSGHLVGELTDARCKLFDEARLRDILKRWIPLPFELLVGRHEVDEKHAVVIYIAPHPDGLCVFQATGQYQEPKEKRPTVVFDEGDVYVRDGTQSRRWQQHDVRRFRQRVRISERERWREEIGDEIAEMSRRGNRVESIAEGPASSTTWHLDIETLEQVIVEQLRRGDDLPLGRLLQKSLADVRRFTGDGDFENLTVVMDRLACVMGLMVRIEKFDWFERCLKVFVRIYEMTFNEHGYEVDPSAEIAGPRLQLEVLRRVMAIGALAVREEQWATLKKLVLQRPRGYYLESGFYTNWIRHGQVAAARAHLTTVVEEDGRQKDIGLLTPVLGSAQELDCLRPDVPNPSDEHLLSSVVTFDLLAMLIVMGFAPGDRDYPYYPSFARYNWHRFEPALATILTTPEIRGHIHPGDDRSVARDIQQILKWAAKEGWNWGGGGPLSNPKILHFLHTHGVNAEELD